MWKDYGLMLVWKGRCEAGCEEHGDWRGEKYHYQKLCGAEVQVRQGDGRGALVDLSLSGRREKGAVHWQRRLVRGTYQETIKCIQKT
jgi:hypothetical protein